MKGAIRVGTSGFDYDHWRSRFYPSGLARSRRLEHYCTQFNTVELNNPFYRLPKRETCESWAKRAPAGFLFAVKASRYITHVKKLRDVRDPLEAMLASYDGFGEALGPILFQFPPNWHADTSRLSAFLELLPQGLACAFEFRHDTWFTQETFGLLRSRGAALCVADSPAFPKALEVTAPFVFVRMHGGSVLYDSNYSEEELAAWAGRVRAFANGGADVFVYFNNDAHGYAIANARRLKSLLGLGTTSASAAPA